MDVSSVNVLSLNCHGFNNGTMLYINRVCKDVDFILLQETWLSDANCYKLTDSFPNYVVMHSSAMEDKLAAGIRTGRPFGGTAVLIRSRWDSYRLVTCNPRVTAVRCNDKCGNDVVIASVYMPFNDGSTASIDEYEEVVGTLQGLLDKNLGCKFIFGGDLNVCKHHVSASGNMLKDFNAANRLQWLDPQPGGPEFTYYNDAIPSYSLIDHFICSPSLISNNNSVCIMEDGDNLSDHLAIRCCFSLTLAGEKAANRSHSFKMLWEKADLNKYKATVCNKLSLINIPVDALLCTSAGCSLHCSQIEDYYTHLVNTLYDSSQETVPCIKVGLQKSWWSPELDDLKQQCIEITDFWKSNGKPRSGEVNEARLRCKYRYKQAIRDAAREEDASFNDSLLQDLTENDSVKFWKRWRKRYCSARLKPTGVLNGKKGDENILAEFTAHYKNIAQPYTPAIDAELEQEVNLLLTEASGRDVDKAPHIDVALIEQCVDGLKRKKAAGLDGITNEHIIFGGQQLMVHLSLLFNAMLNHSFVPSAFTTGLIVPLLKNKHGDATSLDMYRGITLSAVISKLFEAVLLSMYKEFLTSDQLQFGFKENSSCTHALFTVKESVKYYVKRGSKVYCCFLDVSKAFDKVLHNGIFKKLLDRNVPLEFVRIIINWYKQLNCSVKWNSLFGDFFTVKCGIRQGSVLSPYLFALYVNDIVEELRRSGFGLHIGQLYLGCALYADDIVLLSATCYGLQKLINICCLYGKKWDVKFNPLKSQLATYGGSSPTACTMSLNGQVLQWTDKVKYLGVTLLSNSCTVDISTSVRKFYGQFNNIMTVMSKCANEVTALYLIRCYCLPTLLYGSEIWPESDVILHKASVAWNNSFRNIFHCCWRESVKPLQFFCHTLPITNLCHQRKLQFWLKLFYSENSVLLTLSRQVLCEFMSIGILYGIMSIRMSGRDIKASIWQSFADTVEL